MKKLLLSLLTLSTMTFSAVAGHRVATPHPGMTPPAGVKVAKASAPAKISAEEADAITDWQSIGTGRFIDGFITQPYGTSSPAQYLQRPEFEESASHPGLYRVVNPYKDHGWLDAEEYDDSKTYYMYVDATDPNAVTIPEFDTGVLVYGNADARVFAASDGAGTMKDGILTFNEWALKYKLGADGGWAVCNWQSSFRLYLPSVPDYTIDIPEFGCVRDGKATITPSWGRDVKNVRCYLHKGATYNTKGWEFAAEKGELLDLTKTSFTFENLENDKYTLYISALDENNEEQERFVVCFHSIVDNPDEWETVYDRMMFTENFVGFLYGTNYGPNTLYAELQRNKANKGIYRVKNMIGSEHPLVKKFNWSCDGDHYLMINAENPDRVYVYDSTIGLDFGDGDAGLVSWTERYLNNNVYSAEDIEPFADEYYGKMTESGITFPAGSLCISFEDYTRGTYYSYSQPLEFLFPIQHVISVASNCDSKYGKVSITDPATSARYVSTDAFSVSIKAEPAEGVKFIKWTDENGENITANTEYTYSGNQTLQFNAVFGTQVKLSEVKNGTMTVTCNGENVENNQNLTPGSRVKVTIAAAAGFSNKAVVINDREIACAEGEYTFTIESETTIGAIFEGNKYQFAVNVAGTGRVEAWSGVDTNTGAPEAPRFDLNTEMNYKEFVTLFFFPALATDGNYSELKSVVVSANGETSSLAIGEDVWESEWKADENVMCADIQIMGDTEVSVVFSTVEASLDTINVADADANAEFYNLQGVRVGRDNLAPGCYIVRSAGKAAKVFVGK